MRLDLMEAFPAARPLEAYERLLLDVMRGDSTRSTNTQEVELISGSVRSAVAGSSETQGVPETMSGALRRLL